MFKESRIETGETPSQFAERLRRYIQQWLTLAGYEKTYEGLENLILRDQFFITCPTDLRVFIKERGKIDLKEMLTHAESYIEAHGYKNHEVYHKPIARFNQEKNFNRNFEEKSKEKFPYTANKYKPEKMNHGEMNGNRFTPKEFSKEKMQAGEAKIVCYACRMEGHKSNSCPNRPKTFTRHTAAAMQVYENNRYKPTRESNDYGGKSSQEKFIQQEDPRVDVVRADEAKNTVTTVDNSRMLNLNVEPSQCTVKVNGIEKECLFDSGASCCVVKRSLIDEATLTGKKAMCTMIDGSTRHFPTATVDIESDYYTGRVEALVIENPVKPIIIGKIKGLTYLVVENKDVEKKSTRDEVIEVTIEVTSRGKEDRRQRR